MALDPALLNVIAAGLAGLAASVIIESLMTPRPGLMRPLGAWALHAGLWLLGYTLLLLPLGRPWFAACGVSAFLLLLILVNNAKYKALREPFVFQDYEYFTDAIKHPRLYIPFLGWPKAIAAALGFAAAVGVGLALESVPAQRFAMDGQGGGIAAALGLAATLIFVGSQPAFAVSFRPEHDLRSLGLLTLLWRYGEELHSFPAVTSSFDFIAPELDGKSLPHMVAVQSESFFDLRPLFPGIRPEVLAEYDRLKAEARSHGRLRVPAWGANTVRTEFSFLTGIEDQQLGAYRFNPYRALAAGWEVSSLATVLRRMGYHTVCVHPYPASFYFRDRVYPGLGFDEFIDIQAFRDADRAGPYVGDVAVAKEVIAILERARGPVFVFVITMENHGPLHLEHIAEDELAALQTAAPPPRCEDLSIYLRHLRNADRMAGMLRQYLAGCGQAAGLCWFGDHVPIMPEVYRTLGAPDGEVEYVLWRNGTPIAPETKALSAHQLAEYWLRTMDLIHD